MTSATNSGAGLTVDTIRQMLADVDRAFPREPWQAYLGKGRLQLSPFAKDGQVLVVDPTAGGIFPLDPEGKEDTRRVVLMNEPTLNQVLATWRDGNPVGPLAERELVAWCLWRADEVAAGR